MANTIDFTSEKTLVITNVMEEEVNKTALTGVRRLMTLADAEKAKFDEYEYLLDKDGNFTYLENGEVKKIEITGAEIDRDKLAVIVRESIKATDRFVQFFRTQQKLLLARGDALKVTVTTAAEYAHYMSLADEGLTVTVSA